MSSMDKFPTHYKYENALKGDVDQDKKMIKFGELNELAYENLIWSINTSSSVGKVAFRLVRNAKSADFMEGTLQEQMGEAGKKLCKKLCFAYSLVLVETQKQVSQQQVVYQEWPRWVDLKIGRAENSNEQIWPKV